MTGEPTCMCTKEKMALAFYCTKFASSAFSKSGHLVVIFSNNNSLLFVLSVVVGDI